MAVDGPRLQLIRIGDEELLVGSVPLGEPPLAPGLTAAESAVVRFCIDGYSYAEIARARGCAHRTVANLLSSVYRKLGVGSRAALVAHFAAVGK